MGQTDSEAKSAFPQSSVGSPLAAHREDVIFIQWLNNTRSLTMLYTRKRSLPGRLSCLLVYTTFFYTSSMSTARDCEVTVCVFLGCVPFYLNREGHYHSASQDITSLLCNTTIYYRPNDSRLFWARWIQYIPSDTFSTRSIQILSSLLRRSFKWSFPIVFLINIFIMHISHLTIINYFLNTA